MSMSQLAGSDITRQAIFLIETGKTRPSMRTLELIASRTGKPVAFFMRQHDHSTAAANPDSRVSELQALCLQRQFDAALAMGQAILEQRLPLSVEAHVRHYVGQALVNLSRPDEALDHIRRAQAILESEPDPWLSVECADWEACALYLKEDPRALSVAERALKLCRSTRPRLPGTEARILEHIATIHVKNHTYERAIALYEEALQAAGGVRDLARLGRTYHGLSSAYQQRGDLVRATEFAHKALALYALEHDMALLARGENELGLLLMRQGQTSRAEEAFRSALGHFDESGTETAKSHVLLSLAELQMKTGRLDESLAMVKKALDLAARLGERQAESTAHELSGRVHELMGKHQLADREFRAAQRILSADGLRARLAESHASYAEMLEARGDHGAAGKHWKEAASLALDRRPAVPRTTAV
jgi:tetratricopeptide (TPR) repeat protein